MVQIVRRKNINYSTPDISSGGIRLAGSIKSLGDSIEKLGSKVQQRQESKDKEYQTQVQNNIKEAQTRMANEQKAFDASDKIVAADMAGRLKNDLLRWNLEQRQNNPNFIGTAEHEKRMRDEYARLANKYGAGLGEAGRAEFTNKTQNAVNEFIGNDVKWAYQQKLKKGEESAKQIAETMNQTAGMYGANGDVQGFKESYSEDRKNLKDYAEKSGLQGTQPALYEADKKSLVNWHLAAAETNPQLEKARMSSKETFAETIPDEMLENVNDIARNSQTRKLDEQLTIVKAGIANAENKKEKKALEKKQKQLEKQIKEIEEKDYTEDAIDGIYKEVKSLVEPEIEKQYKLHQLQDENIARQVVVDTYTLPLNPEKHYEAKVAKEAQMAQVLGRKTVEDLFGHSISDEAMNKSYNAAMETDEDVSASQTVTFQANDAMFEAMDKAIRSNPNNPLETVKASLDGFAELKDLDMPESAKQNYKNIMYRVLQDKAFGDLVEGVLSNKDRYYPDTTWLENAFGRAGMPVKEKKSFNPIRATVETWTGNLGEYIGSLGEQEKIPEQAKATPKEQRLAEMGLTTTNVGAQDEDTVQRYLQNQAVNISNNTMAMLAIAAKEENPERRTQIGQEAIDYFVNAKKEAFDYAMLNFGIDLAKLREVYKNKGEAITQIGSKWVKYVGDDPSTGLPQWEDYYDKDKAKSALDRIYDAIKLMA